MNPTDMAVISTVVIAIAYYIGVYHGRVNATPIIIDAMLTKLEKGGYIQTKKDKDGEVELIKINDLT
jgi:hypothetical protein|tara:strand:- start:634 stop:834 length:201 start_codon:yes stop_codon:yes gene_type:complete